MGSLEKIVVKTFEQGYNHKFESKAGKYLKNVIVTSLQPDFQDSTLLDYLSNPGSFDLKKTLQILCACDSYFKGLEEKYPESSIRSLKHRPAGVLLPILFTEKIRIPFVYDLEEGQEKELKEQYDLIGEYTSNPPKHPRPFECLKQELAWWLSISENEMAQSKRGLNRSSRLNFSLASLIHSEIACKSGKEKDIDYNGYLGTYWFTLGAVADKFKYIRAGLLDNFLEKDSSLIEQISEYNWDSIEKRLKGKDSFSKLSRVLFYRKGLEAIKTNPKITKDQTKPIRNFSIDDLCGFCFIQAKEHYEEFFRQFERGDKLEVESKRKKTYAMNRLMLGKSYFLLAHYSTDENEKLNLLQNSRENFQEAMKSEIGKKGELDDDLGMWRYYAKLCGLAELGELGTKQYIKS